LSNKYEEKRMAAKNKTKKKSVKKAAGKKPVAKRKKREPVQHGLPPDPPAAQTPVSYADREAVANVLLDRGDGGTRPEEPAPGGTVGLHSGEGSTKTMKIFKAEAEGDTIYVEAEDLDLAKNKFTAVMGEMPEGLVTWSEVDSLPEGEELMAEPARLDDDPPVNPETFKEDFPF
jgi:hypothetical protein